MKAEEVKVLVITLKARVDPMEPRLDRLEDQDKLFVQALNDQRRQFETEIALLKREVEELKSRRDAWGGRLFALALAAVGAAFGVLLTNLFKTGKP